MLQTLVLYLGFGCLAGLLSGLFGIGGGIVIVPFLMWQLAREGFPGDLIPITAIATSLATIVVTSFSSVYAHHRRGAVSWPLAMRIAPGILAGTLLGSVLADHLPVIVLKLSFALFLLAVAMRMLLTEAGAAARPWRLGVLRLTGAGAAIGMLSAIVGIGGGTLSVPLFTRLGFNMREAVATSSACGFPIAAAGSASYILLGWQQPALPAGSLGYVYLPALAGIVVSSVLLAPLGARLAHQLPTGRLKKLFALAILVIGGRMLWLALST